MANNISGDVWILDTAGTISTKPVAIMGFVFKPAVNGDDVLVTDAHGKEIIDWKASNDILAQPQFGLMLPRPKTYSGLKITTIDGGKLSVYLA